MPRHASGRLSPVMAELIAFLREWAVDVTLIHPEEDVTDLAHVCVDHDLYVLKSSTELSLSYAGALDALGARMINPYPVTVHCRDKIVATRILQAAGVPVPETYVTADAGRLAPLLDGGPLVVKPYRGAKGHGVRVVWDADELGDLPAGDGPLYAQRYHEPSGRDRKLYCIGGQLFGVKRVWPARTYAEKLGEPFTLTPQLRGIALRCAAAFGTELFGLDVIESGDRAYVVDINPFPGFKGVPEVSLRLADYVYAAAQRGPAPLAGALP